MSRSCLPSVFVAVCMAILAGCGGSGGVQRHVLEGMVTFEGDPGPYGTISFEPDRKRGGQGPAGFARIKDGYFSTDDSGKGSVAGPMKVKIAGFPSDKPFTPPLFRPYIEEIDVTGEAELKFEVPVEFKAKAQRRPPVRPFEG